MCLLKKVLFCLLFVLTFSIFPEKKVVLFDLNGVLLDTKRSEIVSYVGIVNFTIAFFNRYDVKQSMFDFLLSLRGPQVHLDQEHHTLGDGQPLPLIWYQHMNGDISGAEVIKEAREKMPAWQASDREKETMLALIEAIFDPKIMATKCMYPIQAGCDLLAELAQQPEVECWILSNLGADAFEALLQREDMQESIFKYVPEHRRIISGNVGVSKPHPLIYELAKDKLIEQDPQFADPFYLASHCVFIDDQEENILGSIKAGIPAHHLKTNKSYNLLLRSENNYYELRKNLKMLNYFAYGV